MIMVIARLRIAAVEVIKELNKGWATH